MSDLNEIKQLNLFNNEQQLIDYMIDREKDPKIIECYSNYTRYNDRSIMMNTEDGMIRVPSKLMKIYSNFHNSKWEEMVTPEELVVLTTMLEGDIKKFDHEFGIYLSLSYTEKKRFSKVYQWLYEHEFHEDSYIFKKRESLYE